LRSGLSLGEIDITKEPTSISPGRNMNKYFRSGDSSIRSFYASPYGRPKQLVPP
jgi:hypothetical protein